MLIRIANREDFDQTASSQSDLGLPCLSGLFWQTTSVQIFRTFTLLHFHWLVIIIIGLDKQKYLHKIVNICLPIVFTICCGCSKEPSYRGGSFEYPQHMFCLRNKIKLFVCYTLLTKGLGNICICITLKDCKENCPHKNIA